MYLCNILGIVAFIYGIRSTQQMYVLLRHDVSVRVRKNVDQ